MNWMLSQSNNAMMQKSYDAKVSMVNYIKVVIDILLGNICTR